MKPLEPELLPVSLLVPARETLRGDAEAIMNTLLWRVGVRTQDDLRDEQDELSEAASATPLHNYPGPGFEHMTTAAWNRLPASYRGSWMECAAEDGGAPRRVRVAVTADAHMLPVFLTDSTRTDRPLSGT